MFIIVLIKQVPDTTDVKIDPKTGTLIREGVESIINPDDVHAIEEALRLKEGARGKGGKVVVVTMGPAQAIDALQEALAMGADEGILLTDKAFAGADTLATSYTLAKCIEKIGQFDLILCGRQAIDGDTAQIGPQVAELLGIPQITYVEKIERRGKKIVAERALEDTIERVEAPLPALLTITRTINQPRYPTIPRIIDACEPGGNIKIWNAADIGAQASQTGLRGSPTNVVKTFAPETRRACEKLTGDTRTVVRELLDRLRSKNVI